MTREKQMHALKRMTLGLLLYTFVLEAPAAQGEMGIGVPIFGQYGDASGGSAVVWGLGNAAMPFPAGCLYLVLTRTTMGPDAFKIAVATMLTAKVISKSVRFYAHVDRDGGCGVDYVQLMD